MTRLRAVVFDMDGVLVDSEPLWIEAEIACFARVGLDLDAERCARTRGLRCDEVVRYWYERAPWPGPGVEQVTAALVREMTRALRERAEPLPGALEAPRLARARGLRVGLATSSPHVLVEAVLQRLGLSELFEAVHSAADHPRGKPDPAVYLAAAAALDLPPAACLAVEDSGPGVRSALDAGMVVAAVPEPALRGDPRMAAAHHRLDSLVELPALLDRLVG